MFPRAVVPSSLLFAFVLDSQGTDPALPIGAVAPALGVVPLVSVDLGMLNRVDCLLTRHMVYLGHDRCP